MKHHGILKITDLPFLKIHYSSSMDTLRLPNVSDFKRYGRFHNMPGLTHQFGIPGDILAYIFPNYYLMDQTILPEEFLNKLKEHCLYLKRLAEYEDFIQDLNDQKELQIRRLEDKIINKKHNS